MKFKKLLHKTLSLNESEEKISIFFPDSFKDKFKSGEELTEDEIEEMLRGFKENFDNYYKDEDKHISNEFLKKEINRFFSSSTTKQAAEIKQKFKTMFSPSKKKNADEFEQWFEDNTNLEIHRPDKGYIKIAYKDEEVDLANFLKDENIKNFVSWIKNNDSLNFIKADLTQKYDLFLPEGENKIIHNNFEITKDKDGNNLANGAKIELKKFKNLNSINGHFLFQSARVSHPIIAIGILEKIYPDIKTELRKFINDIIKEQLSYVKIKSIIAKKSKDKSEELRKRKFRNLFSRWFNENKIKLEKIIKEKIVSEENHFFDLIAGELNKELKGQGSGKAIVTIPDDLYLFVTGPEIADNPERYFNDEEQKKKITKITNESARNFLIFKRVNGRVLGFEHIECQIDFSLNNTNESIADEINKISDYGKLNEFNSPNLGITKDNISDISNYLHSQDNSTISIIIKIAFKIK